MPSEYTILVLISGRGSNLLSIIEKAQHYRVIGVISNRATAAGLAIAAQASIPQFVFDRSQYNSRQEVERAIQDKAIGLKPDIIALAGFMQILSPEFTSAFAGRLINIHPSLLPKYPGLDTHKRALEAKDEFHGCSVHLVDGGVDTGTVIAQCRVPVLQTDSAESLGGRVLDQEHRLYPWVLNHLADGSIQIVKRGVSYSHELTQAARREGFVLPLSH